MRNPHAIASLVIASAVLSACMSPTPKLELSIKPHEEARNSLGARVDHYELGKYYQSNGRLGLAMEAYAQALKINNGHVEARNALATLYSQQGRLSEAETLLREVVGQGTSAAYLHNNLGYIYYLQGNHVAAIKELRSAINVDPGHEWARNNLKLAEAALDRRMAAHIDVAPSGAARGERAASTIKAFEVWGEANRVQGKMEQNVDAARGAATEVAKPAQPEMVPKAKANVVAQVLSEPTPRSPLAQILPRPPFIAAPTVQLAKPQQPNVVNLSPPVISRNGKYRLEVSNGNGVNGFAKRVSVILAKQGIPTLVLTNHLPFQQVTTEIQYRAGFEREAEQLRSSLRGHAVVASSGVPRSWVDLRVVLGKDITTHIAELDVEKPAVVAASTRVPGQL